MLERPLSLGARCPRLPLHPEERAGRARSDGPVSVWSGSWVSRGPSFLLREEEGKYSPSYESGSPVGGSGSVYKIPQLTFAGHIAGRVVKTFLDFTMVEPQV